MPELGDIRKASDLGRAGHGYMVYADCPDCDASPRWVQKRDTRSLLHRRCPTCSKKAANTLGRLSG